MPMQGFDEIIRVNLPIDMNKARATNKRRQEKFKKPLGPDRVEKKGKEQDVPAAPKSPAKVTKKAADTLSSFLFPQGL